MTKPPIRIAVLHFSHETVTFLPNDTTVDDFIYEGSPAKGDAMLAWDPKSYMGGFVKVAREFDGVALVGIESPYWPKTGIGSGWVTEDAYERFVGVMIREIKAQGPFDGVYLAVHGAMGVRGVPQPEAELARRVREAVGPGVFITATFDPHGNEDEAFLQHANMAFTGKYFPHYDSYLQGERAARTLVRAIRGDYTPAHTTVKVPILSPTVVQWTGSFPWMNLIQRALTWEAREPDTTVNVFFGFPWSDVPDVGMTIQVLTNGKPDLAKAIADDMAQAAWRQKDALLTAADIHPMALGVDLAKAAAADGRTPVVLADYSDRSGAATWLLQEIIAQDMADVLIVTVTDAKTIATLTAQGVKAGDAFDGMVGGLADESAGNPVRIQGTILGVSPGLDRGTADTWVNISFGRGNVLVLSPFLAQIVDPSACRAIGLEPADFKVFAIKSRAHFRRGFDDSGFAKTILLVEPPEPFLGTVHLDALPYENVDVSQYYPYGQPGFP